MSEEVSYMTPREVAQLFGVDTRTVSRWAKQSLISFIVLPGGNHKRYYRTEIENMFKKANA